MELRRSAYNWKGDSSVDEDVLDKALLLATKIHQNQTRKDGSPYITHPVAVANMLCDIGCGTELIAAGLLHDVIEDSNNPDEVQQEMEQMFSQKICHLVLVLSKDLTLSKEDAQEKYVQTIINESQNDIGVLFIKVADIIHNLSTIKHLPPKRRNQWMSELMNDYLPILKECYTEMNPSYQKSYDRLMDHLTDNLSSIS